MQQQVSLLSFFNLDFVRRSLFFLPLTFFPPFTVVCVVPMSPHSAGSDSGLVLVVAVILFRRTHQKGYRMVFASISKHASRVFIFASTSIWQAVAKILRARASEHASNFCEQFEQRPNCAGTFKLNETILYPYHTNFGSWSITWMFLLHCLSIKYAVSDHFR